MGKQAFKRDLEMVRIFLILAVLTAGFVWAVQCLILTPVTIGHNLGHKNLRSMPSNTEPYKGVGHAGVFGMTSNAENLSSQEGPLLELFQSYFPTDKSMSFWAEDSRK